ncbi:HigA family addiction module antitoxin [Brachybacterium alimentarium]|uniref:HigA family addiction module antitoxin n=1 Tax=Brachybacterium alimentarium TaxID=47845 RepID=UPI0030B81675
MLARRRRRLLTVTDIEGELAPFRPGEFLMEDFIEGFDITPNTAALSNGDPSRRICESVHGKRSIATDAPLRFGKQYGTTAQFWLDLQTRYDPDLAEDRAAEQVAAIEPLRSA